MIRQITQVSGGFFMMDFSRTLLDFHLFVSSENVSSGEINTTQKQTAGSQKQKIKTRVVIFTNILIINTFLIDFNGHWELNLSLLLQITKNSTENKNKTLSSMIIFDHHSVLIHTVQKVFTAIVPHFIQNLSTDLSKNG